MCYRPESSSCATAGRRTLSLWSHVIPISKPARGDKEEIIKLINDAPLFLYFFNNRGLNPCYSDYFDKLFDNKKMFSDFEDKILYILDTTFLLYRNLNIVSKTAYKYCIDYCLEY